MPLHLPELLLLFCFAGELPSRNYRTWPVGIREKDGGNIRPGRKFWQRTQAVWGNESGYALAIKKATAAERRVLKKLTESLFSIPRRCSDAPR